MRVLSITHQRNAASGVFGDAVVDRGHELDEWDISRIPEPPAPIYAYSAVLVFGGAMQVDQEERHGWLRDENALLKRLLADEVPTFGVCLGGQLLAKALGGPVRRMPSSEVGWFDVELTPEAADDPVFSDLPARFTALQWHSYHFELPHGAVPLARNDRCLQAFGVGAAWGIQFHPEVTHAGLIDWAGASKPEEDGPLDVQALLAESDELIGGWNAFGKKLCGRFLAVAEGSEAPTPPGATTRATSPRS